MIASSYVLLCAVAAQSVYALHDQETLRGNKAHKHLDVTHDLFGFHKNLTQVESITQNEEAVGEWLVSSLKGQGYNVERQVVSKDPSRFNVLAWPGKQRDAHILLSSHIDTVSSN